MKGQSSATAAWDKSRAITHLRSHARPHSLGRCAQYVREAVEAGGVTLQRHEDAKDYGGSLIRVGFIKVVQTRADSTYLQRAGDVAIIQPISKSPYGHMTMFDGTYWISDFKQLYGLYPGPTYRSERPPYAIYRFPDGAGSGDGQGTQGTMVA
jgi:hypothetical protein